MNEKFMKMKLSILLFFKNQEKKWWTEELYTITITITTNT